MSCNLCYEQTELPTQKCGHKLCIECSEVDEDQCPICIENNNTNKANFTILDYLNARPHLKQTVKEFLNDSDVISTDNQIKFDDREYLAKNGSKMNFLSKSFEDKILSSDEPIEQIQSSSSSNLSTTESSSSSNQSYQVKEIIKPENSDYVLNIDNNSKCLLVNNLKQNKKQDKPGVFIIILLFIINLLNFIDRFTLAGVLRELQDYYNIDDSKCGLLQTAFICSYMLLAPLFGYLGDRYSRKWIIIIGVTIWSLTTLLGAFVPRDQFWVFVLLRSLVGVGEASYSCIAPTIIGDLFTGQTRTRSLAIFYLAVPLGSGLGYITGSNIAEFFNDWRFSLCFTPPLGLLCTILFAIFVNDPKRGGAEGSAHHEENTASILSDTVYLLKNKTFIWITIGFTFASFVLGGLSWWVPAYVEYAVLSNNQTPYQIPLIFGVVTCISGIVGVSTSSILAPKFRSIRAYADPMICAIGSLIAVPALFAIVLITRDASQVQLWIVTSIGITAMCLSWAMIADILLYVIHPNKRSIASALNILIVHLFGDSGSPYIIGMISDYLRSGKPDTYFNRFTSLQTALYAGPFFAALSFGAYLMAAIYVEGDKKIVDLYIKRRSQLGQGNETDTPVKMKFQKTDSGIGSLYLNEPLNTNKQHYDDLVSDLYKKEQYTNPLLKQNSIGVLNEVDEFVSMTSLHKESTKL